MGEARAFYGTTDSAVPTTEIPQIKPPYNFSPNPLLKIHEKTRSNVLPCWEKINTLKQSRVTSRIRGRSSSFFYWRRATLVQIYKKIFWGAPPKITPHFLDFSKKSATQKTRFFPADRNFGHRFLKKGPKTSIFEVPDLKNFFRQTFDKKTPTHQKFRLGPSPSTF